MEKVKIDKSELEMRFKVLDVEKIRKKLLSLDGIQLKQEVEKQQDHYLKHSTDLERKLIFRVRMQGEQALISLKKRSHLKEDICWQDVDLPVTSENANRFESILLSSGYEKVVNVEKNRTSYRYENYEINLDEVVGLGNYLEVECIVDSDNSKLMEKEKIKMLDFLRTVFGIQKEDIIYEGYVPLMLKRMYTLRE
jgi:predicted adenylyl cyclase CyaB